MCPQRVSPTTINFRRLQLLHFALFQPTSFKVKPCCVFQGLEDWGIIEKKRGKLWRNFSGLQLGLEEQARDVGEEQGVNGESRISFFKILGYDKPWLRTSQVYVRLQSIIGEIVW
ncbi:uncharacterized protein LOC100577798 isoform X2 [Apis mellifera]|nr:uncharacterized protein LOC100577798 isoform X2 [Apis mellifera]|eukprot:XP_026296185.1 uncharacterized protein LOC100577798 isoform X2 [Apis mellifera]